MNVIVSTDKLQYVLAYLEHVVIDLPTSKEPTLHVCTILMLLPDWGVALKLKKWYFLTDSSTYVGRLRHPRRLNIVWNTNDAIRDL